MLLLAVGASVRMFELRDRTPSIDLEGGKKLSTVNQGCLEAWNRQIQFLSGIQVWIRSLCVSPQRQMRIEMYQYALNKLNRKRHFPLYLFIRHFSVIITNSGFRVPGSGFRVPGSGFRVPGSGFRVPGSGFRVPGSGFRVPGSGFRVPGSGFRVPGSGFRVPGSGFRVPGSGFRVPGSGFRIPGFKGCPISSGLKKSIKVRNFLFQSGNLVKYITYVYGI
ncbi:PREDICTED: uncharacterized protein LOC107334447 [Acropora digitifera]|uniref:uncharacterized protein LOC107334447 n=1 Tax=Acropora digitifera TaxID=70779 RepID=UPI00077A132A|nr:PREDICTED: uncharacterized protein LOC107334447 [Acropora digitifera]